MANHPWDYAPIIAKKENEEDAQGRDAREYKEEQGWWEKSWHAVSIQAEKLIDATEHGYGPSRAGALNVSRHATKDEDEAHVLSLQVQCSRALYEEDDVLEEEVELIEG